LLAIEIRGLLLPVFVCLFSFMDSAVRLIEKAVVSAQLFNPGSYSVLLLAVCSGENSICAVQYKHELARLGLWQSKFEVRLASIEGLIK
jgi:hypothetical protein